MICGGTSAAESSQRMSIYNTHIPAADAAGGNRGPAYLATSPRTV
jgi:hypothetical protein